jgi:hypothetical protein
LTSTLVAGEWSTLPFGWPLYPLEKARDINWIRGWVGPRTGLDEVDLVQTVLAL